MGKEEVQSALIISLGGIILIGAFFLATRKKEVLLVAEA